MMVIRRRKVDFGHFVDVLSQQNTESSAVMQLGPHLHKFEKVKLSKKHRKNQTAYKDLSNNQINKIA